MNKPACIIIGIGPGNGLSFAKKFSNEGYSVALCSRNLERLEEYSNQIYDAYPFEYDVTDIKAADKVFS